MSTSNNGSHFKKWLLGILLVAAAVALLALLGRLTSAAAPDPGLAGRAAALVVDGKPQAGPAAQAGLPAPAPGKAWFDAASPVGTSIDPPATASPLSTMSPPHFSADGRGKLILNSDTHANLEKLLLEENPAAMQATLAKIMNTLPPQAAAELKALVGQFQQYTKALSHSISPENAPDNAQEGFKLLDSLHNLRVSYLGADAARAMFGPEEATTRQLIALMEAEKDAGLTPQQKAERAQEILRRQAPPG